MPATNRRCRRANHSADSTAPSSHVPASSSGHSIAMCASAGAASTAATSLPGCSARRPGAIDCPTPGRGSMATASANGTSAQATYAILAPKAWRSGMRRTSTRTTEAETASVPSTSQRSSISAPIVDLPDQPPELIDIVLAELAALAEVRHQRGNPAAEQAVQHAFALTGHPGLPAEHRGIQVTAAFAFGADRALLQQAVEQGLDRWLGPVAARGELGDHLVRAEGAAVPQHFHHDRLGFAVLHSLHL